MLRDQLGRRLSRPTASTGAPPACWFRLDKDTARALGGQFNARGRQDLPLAVVRGHPPGPAASTTPCARRRDDADGSAGAAPTSPARRHRLPPPRHLRAAAPGRPLPHQPLRPRRAHPHRPAPPAPPPPQATSPTPSSATPPSARAATPPVPAALRLPPDAAGLRADAAPPPVDGRPSTCAPPDGEFATVLAALGWRWEREWVMGSGSGGMGGPGGPTSRLPPATKQHTRPHRQRTPPQPGPSRYPLPPLTIRHFHPQHRPVNIAGLLHHHTDKLPERLGPSRLPWQRAARLGPLLAWSLALAVTAWVAADLFWRFGAPCARAAVCRPGRPQAAAQAIASRHPHGPRPTPARPPPCRRQPLHRPRRRDRRRGPAGLGHAQPSTAAPGRVSSKASRSSPAPPSPGRAESVLITSGGARRPSPGPNATGGAEHRLAPRRTAYHPASPPPGIPAIRVRRRPPTPPRCRPAQPRSRLPDPHSGLAARPQPMTPTAAARVRPPRPRRQPR